MERRARRWTPARPKISAISRASESCGSVAEPVTPTVFAMTGGTEALKKAQRGRARPANYQQ